MSRIATRIAIAGAAATGLFTAFLALSPTAAAQPSPPPPAPAPAPSIPGMPPMPGLDNVFQQLAASPLGGLPGMLQNAASVLTGGPQASAAAAAPTPAAPAAPLNVPSTPGASTTPPNPLAIPETVISALSGVPGMGGAPAATPTAPGSAPIVPAPAPIVPVAPPVPGVPNLVETLNPIAALP